MKDNKIINLINTEEKIDDLMVNRKAKENFIFINFPFKNSLKITPYYSKIKETEIIILKKKIDTLLSINLRLNDSIGKLHVILMKLIDEDRESIILLNNTALTENSLCFLSKNFNRILDIGYPNLKVFIINESSLPYSTKFITSNDYLQIQFIRNKEKTESNL